MRSFILSGIFVSAALLAGCGGGGGGSSDATPTYDYSKHNGTYDCVNISSQSLGKPVYERIKATFTSSDVTIEAVTPSTGTVVLNEYVGFSQGFPRYSKTRSTVSARTIFFSADGSLGYGDQDFGKINTLTFYAATIFTCTKLL